MDYETLAKQLIRSIRGKRSQVALARRLGYSSNVLYTWESGRRWPTAAVFFELCHRVKLDVPAIVAEFLGGLPPELAGRDFSKPDAVATFLRSLREGATTVELSRRAGVGRVSVGRWLKGEAEPRLPDFLKFIDIASLRLLDFLAGFVEPDSLPEARQAWRLLEAQRRVAYGLPWSHAVMRALELEAYRRLKKHRPGWIAERLGLSLNEEERCLLALSDSGLIAKRRHRWVVTRIVTVDTRRNPEAGRLLKRHWADVGRERLPVLEPQEEDLFSYNLFTVSEHDWQRLRELHIAYYHELRRIIEASAPAERVALINLQLLRLG
jgi:transcriptional regulator with XRE-family HTH domain